MAVSKMKNPLLDAVLYSAGSTAAIRGISETEIPARSITQSSWNRMEISILNVIMARKRAEIPRFQTDAAVAEDFRAD